MAHENNEIIKALQKCIITFDTPTAKAASSPFGMSGILKCLCERSPFLFCSSLQMRGCHHPS